MICLNQSLATQLAAQVPATHSGCLEWGRYSGEIRENGIVHVYAWVNNTARKIGVMSRDGKHAVPLAGADRVMGACTCEKWRAPTPAAPWLDEWRMHAEAAR